MILIVKTEVVQLVSLHLIPEGICDLLPWPNRSHPQISYPSFNKTNIRGLWCDFGCREEGKVCSNQWKDSK